MVPREQSREKLEQERSSTRSLDMNTRAAHVDYVVSSARTKAKASCGLERCVRSHGASDLRCLLVGCGFLPSLPLCLLRASLLSCDRTHSLRFWSSTSLNPCLLTFGLRPVPVRLTQNTTFRLETFPFSAFAFAFASFFLTRRFNFTAFSLPILLFTYG